MYRTIVKHFSSCNHIQELSALVSSLCYWSSLWTLPKFDMLLRAPLFRNLMFPNVFWLWHLCRFHIVLPKLSKCPYFNGLILSGMMKKFRGEKSSSRGFFPSWTFIPPIFWGVRIELVVIQICQTSVGSLLN